METHPKNQRPVLEKTGIGLRMPHVREILASQPPIPWFEVLTDNHMVEGGAAFKLLEEIREIYPVALHSVGSSIGSTDPIDKTYLEKIRRMRDHFNPAWVSEHLCWTSVHGHHFPDLLPLPFTEETIVHVSRRIKEIQDFLGERILIENVSSYLQFQISEMPEWEFIARVVDQADCYLLFDVNNVYVNCVNHGLDIESYLQAMPKDRIKQMHLAGFDKKNGYLLDAHGSEPAWEVWQLFESVIDRFGDIPTLIEWDNNLPDLQTLMAVAQEADRRVAGILDAA